MAKAAPPAAAHATDEALWHDVECASYAADLAVWDELAQTAGGPILELGCGTGRVALRLASQGHEIVAVDSQPALVRGLKARARERGLRVRAAVADARSFERRTSFALVIAPMQVVQLLGGVSGRSRMLERVRDSLISGGRLAAALANPFEGIDPTSARPPLPDIREQGGWIYSSTPVAMRVEPEGTVIERVRAAISPAGELAESLAAIRLDSLAPEELEREGCAAGLIARARLSVPATPDYAGSTVVVLERP